MSDYLREDRLADIYDLFEHFFFIFKSVNTNSIITYYYGTSLILLVCLTVTHFDLHY